MKISIHTLALVLLIAVVSTDAQDRQTEDEIRKLEAEQVTFLLRGDVNRMKDRWTADYTVNNPFNVVQVAANGPIQSHALTYRSFTRNIEKVIVRANVVIVMGNELVVPKTAPRGSSHDTADPISRRFTNIWMRIDSRWLMIARHANVVCSNLEKD